MEHFVLSSKDPLNLGPDSVRLDPCGSDLKLQQRQCESQRLPCNQELVAEGPHKSNDEDQFYWDCVISRLLREFSVKNVGGILFTYAYHHVSTFVNLE